MRKSLLAIACLLTVNTFAQYYYTPHFGEGQNPGNLNNDDEVIVGNGPPAGWTSIHAGSAASPEWTASVNIPFSFSFNGAVAASYKVSTSGVLTFSTSPGTAPSYTNAALPSASIPAKSVCVWGLSGTASNDVISHKTFGVSPNRQHWVMFSSYSFPEGPSNAFTYWSIVLEETSNKIYIVDHRYVYGNPKLTIGVQVSSSEAVQVSGSPNVQSVTQGDITATDNAWYEFIYGTQPAWDASVTSLTTADFLATATPVTIAGKLENRGSNKLTSIKMNYSVNGASAVSSAISGISVSSYATYSFSHPTQWTPPASGTYEIKVWASDLNGNADVNASNDTLTYFINVGVKAKQRLPLHEEFTSSTCGPCASANASLQPILDANASKCTVVKYQMNWPGAGDPYYTAEGGSRKSYYGVPAVPYMRVDGDNVYSNPGGYTASNLNNHYSSPSYIEISGYFNVNGTTVKAEALANPVGSFNSKNLVMHMVVIEKETHDNIATNGETKFEHVMKKMLPNEKGTAVTLRSGNAVIVSETYTFPSGNTVEEFSDLAVVVFVQDKITQEVLQSGYLVNSPTGVMASTNALNTVNIFPNPSEGFFNIQYFLEKNSEVEISMYNSMGVLVASNNQYSLPAGTYTQTIDASMFSAGVYWVNISTGDRVESKRIIITK